MSSSLPEMSSMPADHSTPVDTPPAPVPDPVPDPDHVPDPVPDPVPAPDPDPGPNPVPDILQQICARIREQQANGIDVVQQICASVREQRAVPDLNPADPVPVPDPVPDVVQQICARARVLRATNAFSTDLDNPHRNTMERLYTMGQDMNAVYQVCHRKVLLGERCCGIYAFPESSPELSDDENYSSDDENC